MFRTLFKRPLYKRSPQRDKILTAMSDLETELIQFEMAAENLQAIMGEHSTEYLCFRVIEHAKRLRERWNVAWELV
ncbi:MAG: hypothetical protein KDJ35_07165 [Alphaproteobacteria bacterium]|nr:hypothetical protein [Alphaproteobacteria bacterium]